MGFVLLLILAATNLLSAFVDPGTDDKTGPPMDILVLDSVLAAVVLALTPARRP